MVINKFIGKSIIIEYIENMFVLFIIYSVSIYALFQLFIILINIGLFELIFEFNFNKK